MSFNRFLISSLLVAIAPLAQTTTAHALVSSTLSAACISVNSGSWNVANLGPVNTTTGGIGQYYALNQDYTSSNNSDGLASGETISVSVTYTYTSAPQGAFVSNVFHDRGISPTAVILGGTNTSIASSQSAGSITETYTVVGPTVGRIELQTRTSRASAGFPSISMSSNATCTASTSNAANAARSVVPLAQRNHVATLSDGVTGAVRSVLGDGVGASSSGDGFFLNYRGLRASQRKNFAANHALAISPNDSEYASSFDPMWNVWLSAKWTGFNGDDFDGTTLNGVAGADYKVNGNVVIGALVGFENDDFDDIGGSNSSLKGSGFTLGGYVGAVIGSGIMVDGLLSYSWLDYDISNGTDTGSFDAGRVSGAFNVSGSATMDNGVMFTPKLGFTIASEKQDGFTDTGSNVYGDETITSGRVSAGTKIERDYVMENGLVIQPFVSAYAEYDFSNRDNEPASTGQPDVGDGFGARLGAGIAAQLSDSVNLNLSGDVGGLGNGEYTSVSGTARIGVRF